MILFLTNNFNITKPLYLWLKQKDKIVLHNKKLSLKLLKKLNPTLIISYNYQYIIPKEITKKYKIINLHISYLPYNKGADPNLWSFIENTPKGVTIHYIDEGIDTGDIIAQKRISIDKNMTLKTSYKKLHFHIQLLFKSIYYKINKIKPKKQKNRGTFHLLKDKKNIILPNGYDTTIKELINENRKNRYKR